MRRAARDGDDFGPGPDASDVIGTRSDAAPAEKTNSIIDLAFWEPAAPFLDLSPGRVVSISDFLKFHIGPFTVIALHSRNVHHRLLERFKILLAARTREPGIRRPGWLDRR